MQQFFVDSTPDKCLGNSAQIVRLDKMTYDGSGLLSFVFDSSAITFNPPNNFRTLFFNATKIDQDCVLTIDGDIFFTIPHGKQGYIPLFVQTPCTIKFTSPLGTGDLYVSLFNFKVQPIIW